MSAKLPSDKKVANRVLIAVDTAMPADALAACRDLCEALAARLGKPVSVAYLDAAGLEDLHAWALIKSGGCGVVRLEPPLAPEAASRAMDV